MFIQFFIHKSILHQCLAIVECTVYLDSSNILPQCSKLLFLYLADLTFRIQYIHMNAFHSQETIVYGTTCITGSSNQHVHLVFTFFPDKIPQQASHKTSAHILKGQCRTMKEFQSIYIVFYLNNRGIETQCIVYNLFQSFCRYIFAKERISYPTGNLLKRHFFYFLKKGRRQRLYHFRHIQAFIGSKTLYYRFFQCGPRSLFIGTIVFHKVSIS